MNSTSFDISNLWEQCMSEMKTRLSDQAWQNWFKPVRPTSIDGDIFTVSVPNKISKEWIEQHYKQTVKEIIGQITGSGLEIDFKIVPIQIKKETSNMGAIEPIRSSTVESMLIPPKNTSVNDDIRLNERYVFDTFVEGPHNRFAKVASKAVGESPGNTSFNPLLIYGGSGLGKTHLLQAIGSHVRQKFPGKNIIYVSSEKFMQDYISALQNNRSRDFTSKYRSCDLLLVDDIQFLESKTGTQEQFFHTFNELYQAGKQIVITADRTPKEMKGVEERLISRFISGLMVDIQPPDLETRIAILKKKALNEDLEIPDEVLSFVANNIKNNVRELESAIIKIFAYSSLTNMDIDITLAKRVIKDILGIKQSSKISIEHILKSVSKTYHISENEIIGKGRQKITAMARQIVMYFARELSGDSLKSIGLRLGGRDHSTVIHACNTIVEKMKKDEDFKSELDTLRNQIELNSLE